MRQSQHIQISTVTVLIITPATADPGARGDSHPILTKLFLSLKCQEWLSGYHKIKTEKTLQWTGFHLEPTGELTALPQSRRWAGGC